MTSEVNQPTTTTAYINDAQTTWGWQRIKYQELIRYRFLLQNLVIRDLKARYKNSFLGIIWSLLNPWGLMLVFTVVFTILSGDEAPRQYPVFILVGLIPWNFFNGALMSGTVSITSNSALIKKVYFPRELLPVSTLLSNLVNFLIAFVVLTIFLYVYDIGLTVHALWVPILLLTQLLFTLGLSLLLSAIAVFYRDILMILDVGMTAWFFLTPIIYSFDTLFSPTSTFLSLTFDPARVMRWLNPMAAIIDGYRTVLWGIQGSSGPVAMDPTFLLRTFLTAVVVLLIGYGVFARLEHLYGEKL